MNFSNFFDEVKEKSVEIIIGGVLVCVLVAAYIKTEIKENEKQQQKANQQAKIARQDSVNAANRQAILSKVQSLPKQYRQAIIDTLNSKNAKNYDLNKEYKLVVSAEQKFKEIRTIIDGVNVSKIDSNDVVNINGKFGELQDLLRYFHVIDTKPLQKDLGNLKKNWEKIRLERMKQIKEQQNKN